MTSGALLQIQIGEAQDADADELDDATGRLREELLELDVEAVERPAAGPAPPGSRGLEIAALGTLLVSLAHDALPVVLATLGALGVAPRRAQRDDRARRRPHRGQRRVRGGPAQARRCLPGASFRRRRVEGRYALIVANGGYRDPKLSRLRSPATDASELARVLQRCGDRRLRGGAVRRTSPSTSCDGASGASSPTASATTCCCCTSPATG